jgi:TBC1 domain family member 20
VSAAENIAMFLLRDAMLDSFDLLLSQLTLLNTILAQEDKEIYQFLMACDLSPYFCISWVITWCSHDLKSLAKITRLFDFFISSDPLMCVYLTAKVSLLVGYFHTVWHCERILVVRAKTKTNSMATLLFQMAIDCIK